MVTSIPPPGFPEKISGGLAWIGADLEPDPALHIEILTENDIAEIETAIKRFHDLGQARGFATPTTFPLSEGLAKRLRAITDHGLDPSRYTEEERVIAYAGITSYVADQRARNIDHIRDRTLANPTRDQLKPLELAVSMNFHTDIDVGDILSMFVQSVPLEGGDQYLASIASIYNNIIQRDPEVLRTLSEDWYWERTFRPAGNKEIIRVFSRPLIVFQENRLQVNFAATFVGGNVNYPLSSNAPPLTPEKRHALEVIQEAAKRTCLHIMPKAGEIIFINNFALLHARASWVDPPDDVWKQRYIMRLWLHDSQRGWKSADALKRKLDDNFDLSPEKQGLLTGDEWNSLPRGMRVKEMGVSGNDCHD